MSLMDFYKNAEHNQQYKKIVFELSQKILANQILKSDDVLDYGRWDGAYSTSGNGWLAEVMMQTYKFCREEKRLSPNSSLLKNIDCEKYKEAVIGVMRWIIQQTYSDENSFYLPNPARARGGIFWSKQDGYVRTDSVCHALNAYVGIIDDLKEKGSLLSLPEPPLSKSLKELGRSNFGR